MEIQLTPPAAGRPSLYLTPKQVAGIFQIGLSTVYKKPEEFGGRVIAGCLRFPRAIIEAMVRRDHVPVE